METPLVSVGILLEPKIEFTLHTPYLINGIAVKGKQTVEIQKGQIVWNSILYDEIEFKPIQAETGYFEIENVTIGINFHWERKENQLFQGSIKFVIDGDKISAINTLSVENYLISVISSEMKANASLELLKAHAVISRSWLLAQIDKNKKLTISDEKPLSKQTRTKTKRIVWYDREDHKNFDVCADDHCQRYQGVTRASTILVTQAVNETKGEVISYNGEICDARFSKCCGGMLEVFESCWEDINYPYLVKKQDIATLDVNNSQSEVKVAEDCELNLADEEQATKWIESSPDAFCDTTDEKILSQVLNTYDQETKDFYRWKVEYNQKDLAKIIKKKSGIDFGEILDIVPVSRGVSGRLIKVKIRGSKKNMTIGKELEIRRILSKTHLYSSAFTVHKSDVKGGVPGSFTFLGAGWGHGVGLCQIGAAVMGEKGYKYDQILLHYYVNANIEKLY